MTKSRTSCALQDCAEEVLQKMRFGRTRMLTLKLEKASWPPSLSVDQPSDDALVGLHKDETGKNGYDPKPTSIINFIANGLETGYMYQGEVDDDEVEANMEDARVEGSISFLLLGGSSSQTSHTTAQY